MRLYYLAVLTLLLSGCAATHTAKVAGRGTSPESGENNLASYTDKRVVQVQTAGHEVVFQGSNNLLDVVRTNAAYFGQAHDVLIIKGSNNIIKLYNINLVRVGHGADTVVIAGSNVKYIMDLTNSISVDKAGYRTDTVRVLDTPIDFKAYDADLANADADRPEETQLLKAVQQSGEPADYYALAEYFYRDYENKTATRKAVELYEYAAAKDFLPAIQRLGAIYANGVFTYLKDRAKARYYLSRGAQMGDAYCQQLLDTL